MNPKLMELREKLEAARKEHEDAKEARSRADKIRRLAEKSIADLTAAILQVQGEEIAKTQAEAVDGKKGKK